MEFCNIKGAFSSPLASCNEFPSSVGTENKTRYLIFWKNGGRRKFGGQKLNNSDSFFSAWKKTNSHRNKKVTLKTHLRTLHRWFIPLEESIEKKKKGFCCKKSVEFEAVSKIQPLKAILWWLEKGNNQLDHFTLHALMRWDTSAFAHKQRISFSIILQLGLILYSTKHRKTLGIFMVEGDQEVLRILKRQFLI